MPISDDLAQRKFVIVCVRILPMDVYNNYTDATVGVNDSVLTVLEEDADLRLCIVISNIPSNGIDPVCEIEVTLNFTGISTCE